MARTLLYAMFTALCTSIFSGTGSKAIRIDISPEKSIATLENDIYITCSSDGDDIDKEVTMMEITKNNQPPIVFLRDCLNISYGSNGSSRFKGEGKIDEDAGKSFLNLTLLRPRSEDSGIYTCVVYHVNKAGILQEEKRSKTLTVEKLDVSSLEIVLNKIKEKMKTNERNTKKDVNEMKEKMMTNERNITVLKENIGYVSAFSASNKGSDITTSNGEVLILPDIIMLRRGEGYNETTGVFTAPTDGLYAFHVVILQLNCNFRMDLMANNKRLARLYSFNQGNWAPSSMSSVADLQAGDKVFSIMRDDNCRLNKSQYTVFTGYLIKKHL